MNYFSKYIVSEKNLYNKLNYYRLKNVNPILDYAIEKNTNLDDIRNYVNKKIKLLQRFPMTVHSLKLSSIDLKYSFLEELVYEANNNGCTYLIDAEDYEKQETINLYSNKFIFNNNFEKINKSNLYKTYQMYRKDSMNHLLNDINLFRELNVTHNIKLVRGAYLYYDNQHNIINDTKKQTDDNYNKAVEILLNCSEKNFNMNVIFATHNNKSIDLFQENTSKNLHHAVLMGMDHHLRFENSKYKINRMVHVPFGPLHKTYPYMLRRLNENNPILDKIISTIKNYKEEPRYINLNKN